MTSKTYEHRKPASDVTHEERQRDCLSCRQPFQSEWLGNRICASCKGTEAYSAAPSSVCTGRRALPVRPS
jgi:Zn finger protein HypA/HybF involved in hydrogenase expression